jgi:D-alanyl-D-alanine carboxypeptidase/D-alanyl-D-alanine-endopeptidase (penicillin-binding protein 4)
MKQISANCQATLYFIIVAIASLSSCISTKFKVDKTPIVKHFNTNSVFRESHTGMMVYDPISKEVLFDYNAQKHFTPASNTKLLTYFAAIHLLGDSIPSIKYCIENDTLFFTGTGDPTLLYEGFGYSKTYDFLKSSPYPLAYVEKPIEDQRFGPGWSWDDYPYYFSAEKSSFPIYGNMLRVDKNATDDFLTITPRYLERQFSAVHKENLAGATLERNEFANEFVLNYGSDPVIREEVPFIYSERLFKQLLADTLQRRIDRVAEFPNGHINTLFAVPSDSVYKQILIESDNFLAEQTLILISDQLGDTLSSQKSIDFVMENYLSELKDEIYWVDGSGLSRYNQVTPNAMVQVLEHIYNKIPREKLFYLLPESGKSGTLENSLSGIGGYVHAKTGSMSHVYNLSGYLETKSGKTLLFSFMNNNFNVSFSELKREMERVLAVFVNDTK